MSTCRATQRRVSHVVRRFLLAGSVVICAGLLAVTARPVSADTFQFKQGGDPANPQEWDDAMNWLDLTTPALNGTLPGAADDVDLNNGMTAKIDEAFFSGTYHRVYIGPDGQNLPGTGAVPTPGSGTLNHSAGVLSTSGGGSWFRLGQSANGADLGTYNMTGTADLEQTNDTLRIGENGTGVMTMTDNAILNSTGLNISDHGNGTFTIGGNAIANLGRIRLADNGGTAVMNIHGNAVINSPAGDFDIGTSTGGTATINQDGGTFNVETDNGNWSALGRDGGTGIYNLSGGTLKSDHWFLVGRGNPDSHGTFNISGTGVFTTRSLWIAQQDSTGVVNQTGGTVNVGPAYAGGANDSGNFRVGFDNGHGTYNLSGGVLNDLSGAFNGVTMKSQVQSMDIADGSHDGTFNQTGGTANMNWIRNGNNNGGTGLYNISGTVATPSVLNAARIMAGTGGTGTFNQTSANTTVNVDNDVSIGDSGGTGVYNISGGVLNAAVTSPYGEGGGAQGRGTATGNESIQIGWNANGTINQTGGTVNALNTPITAPDANVVQSTLITGIGFNGNNAASGVGVYNLSGGTLNTAAIFKVQDGGTGTFNFNGGTLRVNGGPTAALPIFMGSGNPDIVDNNPAIPVHTKIEALTAANVQTGGAIIDLNSFGITISQPLLHSGAVTDGGLSLKDTSAGGGGSLTLTGANTFNGPTTITPNGTSGPTLRVGNSLALQNSTVNVSTVLLSPNSVQFTTGLGSATFGALASSGNLSLNDTGAAAVSLTAGGNNSTTAYSGVMSGLGSFTKTGTGNMTLSANQTYSGTTRVNGGSLVINGITLPNTSSVTVGGASAVPGSSPTLAGAASITNGLTINGVGGTGDAGHLSPHLGAVTGTLNVGSLTLNGGSILDLNMGAPGTTDLIASVGALTLPGAGTGNVTVNLTDLGGFTTGTYKFITSSSTLNFTNTTFSIGVGISGFQEGFSNGSGATLGKEVDLIVTPAPTWKTVAVDTNWANANNWVGGLIPGSTSSTSNTDLAAFTNNSNILNPAPDLNRNLQNITFDLPTTGAYVIGTTGGNALLLTSGGKIQSTSLVTQTETINAPLVLEGANGAYTFSNNAAAAANVLVIGGGVTGGAAGNTVLTLSGTNTGANAVNGVIGNGAATTVAVMKTGSGTWILGGNNTYTGGVDIEAGTLRVGNAGALNSASPSLVTFGPASNGTLAINGINVTINGLNSTSPTAQVINGNATPATLTVNTLAPSSFAGVIADGAGGGALSLIVTDAGLTLSGNNTFTGTTDVTGAATLTLASANALQNSTLHVTVNNNVLFSPGVGTFTIGGLSGGGNVTLQDTGAGAITASVGNNGGSTTYSGVLSGVGGLTKVGGGTLTLTNANTYTGTTRISAGTLQLGDGTTSNGSVASGVIINNASLVFANPAAQTYAGSIVGTGSVTKTTGAGILTLTGNSTYSGGTTIGGGSTVRIGPAPFAATPLGSGTVTLTGATLALRGSLASGLTTNLYNNTPAPGDANGNDPDYLTLTAMNAHFTALGGPAVSVLTSFNGKTNLDYSNSNGARAPMFGGTGPTQANYGFPSLDNFEANLTGKITINTEGDYTFSTTSDDGSVAFLDGADAPVVNNNFYQGMTTRSGTVHLTAGQHQIDLGFYEGGGGLGWTTQYSGPDTAGALIAIPSAILVPDANPLAVNAVQAYTNGVTVTGNSTIDISGSLTATFSGGVTIGANTLNVTSSDVTANPYSLTFNGASTLNGNATFNVANSAGTGPGTLRLAAVNQGAGGPFGITKAGAGTLLLSTPGNYAGGTTIQASGGTVFANGPGTLGTGAVTLNNATTLRLATNPNPPPTIAGFNNGTGWTVNNGGGGTNLPPFGVGPNTLTLTNSANDIARSVILNNRVNIANGFVITFTYTMTGGGGNPADGIAVFLENDPRGVTALGGGGGSLGYGPGTAMTPSVAYEMNVYNGNPLGTNVAQNGTTGGYNPTGNVNFRGDGTTGDPTNVKLLYDPVSQTLTEFLTDTVNNATFTNTYATGDLTTLLGDTQAFFGFSGATGGLNAIQTITNFGFAPSTETNYSNAVIVNGGVSTTFDLSSIGPSVVNMGALTVNAGVGTTMNFSATAAPANSNYGFGFASATFNGSVAMNIANNGSGTGTVSVNGPSTFVNGVAVNVNSGRLRFANTGGASTIGSGTNASVTVNVITGASLELAGTTSNLSDAGNPSHRVHIVNNSKQADAPGNSGGVVFTGTNQQVGAIDGTGDTAVKDGGSGTANHIVQNALIIGSAGASPSVMTIAASDASGNPMAGGLAVAGSLDPGTPFGSGSSSSSSGALALDNSSSGSLSSPVGGGVGGSGASVPEPSSLLLVLLGGLACLAPVVRRRRAKA